MENLGKPLFLSKLKLQRTTPMCFYVSFKNGMTEKINLEQLVNAYVIDAHLPLNFKQ